MTRMLRAGTMLLPALSFVMQSCWVLAWVSLLEQATVGSATIAPMAILLFLIAAAWRSFLPRLTQRRVLVEVLFWAAWPLAAALAAKLILFGDMSWPEAGWFFALPRAVLYLLYETRAAELLLFLGSGLAWFLGRRLASQPVSYARLLGDFQFGIIMLLAAFLVSHGLEQGLHRPVLLSLAFFCASLSGIAMARGARDGESSLSRGHFTGTIFTLIAIVSAIGLLIGMALTPDVLHVLLDAIKYIGHLFAEFMRWIASLIPESDMEPSIPAEPPTGDDSALREFYRSLPFPVLLARALRIGWFVMVLGLVIASLWQVCAQVLAWLRKRMDMGEGVELESLERGFLAELAAFFRQMATRLGAIFSRVLHFAQRTGRRSQPATVRSVYVGFVKWASKKVLTRQPWQSPREYMSALSEYLPAATPDLAMVTETYVQARYGRHEPVDGVIQQMTDACKRIRRNTRSVKKQDSSHTHKEGDES